MPSLLKLAALPLIAVGVATMIGAGSHDEAALMSDWSAPPPWPIFIALNVLAGGLRAAADALTPPPIKMLDMAMAYHSTQLVHVAQRFEIPDLLAAEGPLTAAQIAAAIGSDADVVERVMYACAAQGVFRLARPEEGKGHRFVNSPLSAVLRKDHPNSLRGMVGHNAEEGFAAWGKLADYVANPSGPNPWDLAMPKHPTSKGGVWDFFQKNKASEAQFGHAMASLDSLGAAAMVADGPWSRFARVIDIGGSMGHFSHRILKAHPSATAVVLDRPPVVALAREQWAEGGAFSSASSRAELRAADFFRGADLPPVRDDGDAYFLRYILHDWPEDRVLQILKNVRAAMAETKATLLIGECALPDHDTVGAPPVMYQIDIQMMAFFGAAKERTPSQWRGVLAEAGFELRGFHPTRSLLHWVEAAPI